jgi:hypothetical protein
MLDKNPDSVDETRTEFITIFTLTGKALSSTVVKIEVRA